MYVFFPGGGGILSCWRRSTAGPRSIYASVGVRPEVRPEAWDGAIFGLIFASAAHHDARCAVRSINDQTKHSLLQVA